MKKLVLAAALAAAMAPVVTTAQAQGADPDKNVAGGVMVKGWTGRVDRPNQKIENAKFVDMAGGLHVTAGPAAIYWNPANVAKGSYTVKASFTQTKAPTHPEAYGLFIGGSNLNNENQNYLYCIIRGDGKFMVKHRYKSETHTLKDWTAHQALKAQDANGKATNEVALKVADDKVSCMVNGAEVASWPRADTIGEGKLESTDGVYGIRVNHNLDVHIGGFGLAK